MRYFGGLGAGKGWWKILFLVEPDILREVISATGAALVVKNRRVPADYQSTAIDDYIASYQRYVNAMLCSQEAASDAEGDVDIGLVPSVERVSYVSCPDARYKGIDVDEPVVGLSCETICYNHYRGQICTNILPGFHFGMKMAFPRVISLARDKHEILYDTTTCPSFSIFQRMKADIQKITSPCKIRSPAREHRTQIRITEGMCQQMRKHPGLKAAQLEIVCP
jgi:hypothetical protein